MLFISARNKLYDSKSKEEERDEGWTKIPKDLMCTCDIGHHTYKVTGFEMFSSSINYLSLNMSRHIYINLIEF